MAGPAYVTRDTILDVGGYGSVIADRIDRAIFTASRRIEDTLNRRFYPLSAAVTYHEPYEPSHHVGDEAFWLKDDLQSASSVTVDGTADTDYVLLPKDGPPYNRIVVGSFRQVDTIITGVWGYGYTTATAGALDAAIAAVDTATCDVTGACSAAVGVGDLIAIEDERLIVTGRTAIDTAANLDGALTAQANDQTVTLSDGTGFVAGEELLIESERLKVLDVAGDDLTVERGYRGTTLASHADSTDVYGYRRLSLERGATGTTAATHADTTAITVYSPPPQIRDYALAEALNQLEQEGAGYARVVGSADNQREARGAGLADVRKQATRLRRVRKQAV